MKIIAIEEAFSIDRLPGVPDLADFDRRAYTAVGEDAAKHWVERMPDFETHRLPDMDANGVDIQILSLTVPGIQIIADAATAIESAKIANDYLAKIVATHPTRFRGFAALPMQAPEAAAEELRRCIRELGFCGALVNDTTHGKYLDAPEYAPVWQALEELDVPLYLHPGARVDDLSLLKDCPQLGVAFWEWQAQVGGHVMRLVLAGVFDRHPKARIIIGHMGEFLPFQTSRFDSRYATFRDRKLSGTPSSYFGRNIFITISGVFSPAALTGALMSMGEDAVLFAIDYPYESSREAVEFLKSAPISEIVREKIAWRNAERLLKLA